MENLLESNERTLVIFDSVCSGLAECLALVHADIKQMSEHRNQLAQLEQEKLNQSKLSESRLEPLEAGGDDEQTISKQHQQHFKQTNLDDASSPLATNDEQEDDPHHLARLKLLDKRLADSFSQALSLCDQQKSSLVIKKQQYQQASNGHSRPSIFQVLLGKTGSSKSSGADAASTRRGPKQSNKLQMSGQQVAAREEPEERVMIDDINRQTRLAMQYAKQLEAHLFRVEDLRANYEMHLKMGLVVKSVSRAYSSSTSTASGASSHYHSPNSLGRRAQHHTSSLLVNDTSSLGTTHSSLSSLNLSSWSFSRRQKSSTSERSSSSRHNSNASTACCSAGGATQFPPGPPMPADDCLILGRQLQLEPNQVDERQYVSTISLDGTQRRAHSKRHTPAQMISASGAAGPHAPGLLEEEDGLVYASPSQYHASHAQAHHHAPPLMAPTNPLAGGCQCQLPPERQRHAEQASVIYVNGAGAGHQRAHRQAATPSPRPASQHGDFVAPTTAGTLSSRNASSKHAEMMMNHQTSNQQRLQQSPASATGFLHKSASQGSLKGLGKGKWALRALGGKTTIKEFIENIERIESEFESYMGSFLLNIEDIQGFARVCQGDVFEITIKYGREQKFKSKISVLKDSRQKCDQRQTVFKARIADVIAIKAYECKGLGKRLLLGHKLCETRDLFTARSQLMTISLNQTGSIKLNLIITWNPLHLAPQSSLSLQPGVDISHISLPPASIASPPRKPIIRSAALARA